VLIRKATPDDLPFIRALEQKSETAAHWAQREYDALFAPEAPARMALVAADENNSQNIYGFVIVRCAADEWEIENVVVDGEHRRRGIGAALVGGLLDEARRACTAVVQLEVRESNAAARRLYQSLGFKEVGRRRGYYREPLEDALLLEISISFL
jgi:ribosomal-protein-alanine N-acetyltransferase